jgi:hypothetical protein
MVYDLPPHIGQVERPPRRTFEFRPHILVILIELRPHRDGCLARQLLELAVGLRMILHHAAGKILDGAALRFALGQAPEIDLGKRRRLP